QTPGELLQVIEPPGERPHAHRQRTQIDDEIMKLRLRQIGIHLVPALPPLFRAEAEYLAAATTDKPMHAGSEIVGDRYLHRTDRLKQNRFAFRHPFAHGDASCRLERHIRAVDGVVLAVIESDGNVDHRKTERPPTEEFARTFLDGGYV